MSQNNSKKVDAPEMSKRTYKKEVAKQRQIKRLRKMKLKDRKDDVRISDVSDISVDTTQQKEEPQSDWLNDLVKTETSTAGMTMPTGEESKEDIRCTAELPRSKSPINIYDGSFRSTLTCIWDCAINNPNFQKITIISVSAIVLAVFWKIRSSKYSQ